MAFFFPQESKQQLQHSIDAFAVQHRKGSFVIWHTRIHRVGVWGTAIAKCLKPIGKQRPKAQQLLEEVYHG